MIDEIMEKTRLYIEYTNKYKTMATQTIPVAISAIDSTYDQELQKKYQDRADARYNADMAKEEKRLRAAYAEHSDLLKQKIEWVVEMGDIYNEIRQRLDVNLGNARNVLRDFEKDKDERRMSSGIKRVGG